MGMSSSVRTNAHPRTSSLSGQVPPGPMLPLENLLSRTTPLQWSTGFFTHSHRPTDIFLWQTCHTPDRNMSVLLYSGMDAIYILRNNKCITRSSATANSTARPSCLVGVLYDMSREWISWWLISHFYVMGPESYRIRRNNAK